MGLGGRDMLFGFIIVVIGILYLTETLVPGFHVDFDIIWPIVIMAFGLNTILKRKKLDMFSTVLLFVGTWYLLLNVNFIPEECEGIFWPIIVIIMGLSIMLSSVNFHNKVKKLGKVSREGMTSYSGIFSGVEEKVKTKDFKGTTIYAVFGGVDLDLRDVEIKENVVINIYCAFGGATLLMPKEYNIIMNSTALFGANENKCDHEFHEKGKTIYVNCSSIFGGTELK